MRTRMLSASLAWACVALLAACSAGGGGGGGGGTSATTAPATCAPITQSAPLAVQRATRQGSGLKPLQAGILTVVQTIPPAYATEVDPDSPVTLFFSEPVNPSTVTASTVTIAGTAGLYAITPSFQIACSGNSIVTVTPATPYAASDMVTVSWNGVKDTGGNTVTAGNLSFTVASTAASPFGAGPVVFGGTGFPSGVTCNGDCAVLAGAFGSAPPVYNSYSAYFTTGQDVSGTPAVADTTSSLTVRGLTKGGNTLTFSYRFISAEFPDYIGTEFDDVLVVSVYGQTGGAATQVVNSVNQLGANKANLTAGTFGNDGAVNISDGGNAMMSGVLTGLIDVSALGSPLTVTFSVSDVGDTIYDTVIQLNNIATQ